MVDAGVLGAMPQDNPEERGKGLREDVGLHVLPDTHEAQPAAPQDSDPRKQLPGKRRALRQKCTSLRWF